MMATFPKGFETDKLGLGVSTKEFETLWSQKPLHFPISENSSSRLLDTLFLKPIFLEPTHKSSLGRQTTQTSKTPSAADLSSTLKTLEMFSLAKQKAGQMRHSKQPTTPEEFTIIASAQCTGPTMEAQLELLRLPQDGLWLKLKGSSGPGLGSTLASRIGTTELRLNWPVIGQYVTSSDTGSLISTVSTAYFQKLWHGCLSLPWPSIAIVGSDKSERMCLALSGSCKSMTQELDRYHCLDEMRLMLLESILGSSFLMMTHSKSPGT